jgi:hypothetical protein
VAAALGGRDATALLAPWHKVVMANAEHLHRRCSSTEIRASGRPVAADLADLRPASASGRDLDGPRRRLSGPGERQPEHPIHLARNQLGSLCELDPTSRMPLRNDG